MQFPDRGIPGVTGVSAPDDVGQVRSTEAARAISEQDRARRYQPVQRPETPKPQEPLIRYERRGGSRRHTPDRRKAQVSILLDTRSGTDRRQKSRRDGDAAATGVDVDA